MLSDEMAEAIRSLASRYPNKRALTLPSLHMVNAALRYVPPQAVVEIAELLDLSPADVQDTLSFYGFFKQDAPHGETRTWVCRSISCALRGGEEVLEHLCDRLNVKPGETTSDGKLTLEYAECLGACDFAPCMLAGNTLHKNLDNEKADAFIDSIKDA